MKRANPMVIMPGGFHYPDPSGQTVRSDIGLQHLKTSVLEYRLANGIPPGNVDMDVEAYICNNFPHVCNESGGGGTVVAHNPQHQERWVDRVIDWLNRMRSMPLQLIEGHVAAARMSVCSGCKYNQSAASGCGTCDGRMRELAFYVRQGKSLAGDTKIGVCRRLDIDLKTAMWMPKDRIKPNNGDPANCPFNA